MCLGCSPELGMCSTGRDPKKVLELRSDMLLLFQLQPEQLDCGAAHLQHPLSILQPIKATPVFRAPGLSAVAVARVSNYTVVFLGTVSGRLLKVGWGPGRLSQGGLSTWPCSPLVNISFHLLLFAQHFTVCTFPCLFLLVLPHKEAPCRGGKPGQTEGPSLRSLVRGFEAARSEFKSLGSVLPDLGQCTFSLGASVSPSVKAYRHCLLRLL